ncbi:MAG TPA: hypothetical protein VM659_28865 [Dongiaceae bacterium]|nr:hypothetical protein [Dongiaceae bacterium]
MKTVFSLLCDRCGLSQTEAAAFLAARRDTVKSWSSGRNRAPDGVIDELRELYTRIEEAAGAASDQIEALIKKDGEPEEIEIGLADDDHEARQLGLPCVGAHEALIGLIVASFPGARFKIVPRGSTPATAAAISYDLPVMNARRAIQPKPE